MKTLTGLNHDELWYNGFDLDDMDWGFMSDVLYDEENLYSDDTPYHIYWILTKMDGYCCGYKVTEYKGKYYYILYHA